MATPEEEVAITEQTEEPTAGEDAITEAEAAQTEKPAGGSSPEDMIGWFNSVIKEYDATFIIYYRGVW